MSAAWIRLSNILFVSLDSCQHTNIDHSMVPVKNPWTGLKYVHVNFMFNLQHFAIQKHRNLLRRIACGVLPVFRKKKQRTIERGSLTKNP